MTNWINWYQKEGLLLYFKTRELSDITKKTQKLKMGELLVDASFQYKFKTSVQSSILYLFLPSRSNEGLMIYGIYWGDQRKNKMFGSWREWLLWRNPLWALKWKSILSEFIYRGEMKGTISFISGVNAGLMFTVYCFVCSLVCLKGNGRKCRE